MKAYPVELRLRAVNYIKRGGSAADAKDKFAIGHDTIYRWLRLEKEGKLEPKKTWGTWKKIDPKKLAERVKANNDATLWEVAKEFGVSDVGVLKVLRRLEITLKKRSRNMSKGTSSTAGFSGRKSKASPPGKSIG
jgi:transposase